MDKSKVRILIVDDEVEILGALQTHLQMDGYEVEVASSAADALRRFENGDVFPIVLADINMPEMDGIEMLEKIKAIRADTIVIMITAYTSLMKASNSRYRGASDFILKPFRDLAEVDEAVGRAYAQICRWDKILDTSHAVAKRAAG